MDIHNNTNAIFLLAMGSDRTIRRAAINTAAHLIQPDDMNPPTVVAETIPAQDFVVYGRADEGHPTRVLMSNPL